MMPKEYLDLLAREGMDLKALGINGVALPKSAALKALELLQQAGFAVLGGDVFRLSDGTIASTYDNWYCRDAGDPGSPEYLAQSISQARAYIDRYPSSGERPALFHLVIGERRPEA